MIVLGYKCKSCAFKSELLNAAQDHSNDTRHKLTIEGFMSPNKPEKVVYGQTPEAIAKKAREAEIMRQAREKGLVK